MVGLSMFICHCCSAVPCRVPQEKAKCVTKICSSIHFMFEGRNTSHDLKANYNPVLNVTTGFQHHGKSAVGCKKQDRSPWTVIALCRGLFAFKFLAFQLSVELAVRAIKILNTSYFYKRDWCKFGCNQVLNNCNLDALCFLNYSILQKPVI